MSSDNQPPTGGDDDAVGLRLAELAANLERELQDVASLEREDLGRGSWVLTPNDQGAVGVAWIDWGDALHLEVLGGHGGRWELGRDDSDLSFLIDVVEAVVEGRVTETFGDRRSRVTVTMPDGSSESETGSGPGGSLPRPFLARRGRVKRYPPDR